jgi:hypothetical protein
MQRTQATPVLEYGSTPRAEMRRTLRWLLGALATLCLAVLSIAIGWYWVSHYQENGVTAELRSIPGAQMLKVAAYEDKPMWAKVSLDASQSKRIRFYTPYRGELNSGIRMSVQEMGSNSVVVYFRDENWGHDLDFGRNSPLAAVLPFRFRDVRDLAAHYDEVEAFLRQQPSGTFVDQSHRLCKYRIEFRAK